MTRICIYGAGAIGGLMAAALAEAGADVSLVARGPHLAALQRTRHVAGGLVHTRDHPLEDAPSLGLDRRVLVARWTLERRVHLLEGQDEKERMRDVVP